jgi:hypothetical protein
MRLGVKEYPYKKAAAALKLWAPGEVSRQSAKLLDIYHQGHQGKVELDLAFEAWLLGL